MAPPLDPPLRHGIREATGIDRPAPGILCWNCRELTPFPAGTCKWCGAAFAGSHGGAYGDHVPDRTVRARVSSPAAAPRIPPKDLGRMMKQLETGQSIVESRLRERGLRSAGASGAGPGAKAAVLHECPVCGRPSPPGARQCRCGAVFGDASTTFNCTECGSVLPIEADHCFVCGVAFADAGGAMYACPLCGAVVPAAATTCRCGAQFME